MIMLTLEEYKELENYDAQTLRDGIHSVLDEEAAYFLGFDDLKENQDILDYMESDTDEGLKFFLMLEDNSKEIIGMAYTYNHSLMWKKISIAIAFHPLYRGKGLGFKFTEWLIDYCKNVLKVRKVVVEIEPTNNHSLKLIEKLNSFGFEYEGRLKSNYGFNVDSIVYGLVLPEPEE